MEGTPKQIEDFLIQNRFVKATNNRNDIIYIKQIEAVQRQMIVNGQRVETPKQYFDFTITYLGEGAILDIDNVPTTPLYGYNMANNDIWVDSFEDFKFWIGKIFTPKPKQYDN